MKPNANKPGLCPRPLAGHECTRTKKTRGAPSCICVAYAGMLGQLRIEKFDTGGHMLVASIDARELTASVWKSFTDDLREIGLAAVRAGDSYPMVTVEIMRTARARRFLDNNAGGST